MNRSNVKKACGIVDKAFLYILKTVKVGESEKDLALRIDKFLKNERAKLSFPTIVGSGPHSAFIHHKPCKRKIRKNEPILLDFGAKVGDFCSDISRTIFIGKPGKEFEDIYKLVLRAQKSAINKLKSNIKAKEIDLISRKIISKKGFGKYFKHTLGHGLGKKVHQVPSISPNSADLLKINDIVTIEPGIYFENKGGVRIEDDIIIKEEGFEILTRAPKEFKEIIINEKI